MGIEERGAAKKKKALRSKSKKWSKRFALTFFKTILLVILAAGIIGICGGLGVVKGILASAPDISNIDVSPTGFSTFVYDTEGNQIAKLDAEGSNRVPVSMDKIPEDLAHAFVAIEDARFYDHNGIDIKGILRAGFIGLTSGHFSEGASTITQQLIKNNVLTSWTSESEKAFAVKVKRKFQEQYLAIKLENDMDKDKILENYMNTINLGQNTLGVQAASKRYFGKNVYELNLSECAVIAAITQNPSRYNPITHPEKNAERREKVLTNMLEQGYISQSEFDAALADDVYSRIQTVNEETGENAINSYFVDALTEAVMDDLEAAGYSEAQAFSMLYTGGLKIYSTQDPTIQSICDEVCSNEENYPQGTTWYLNYQLTIQRSNGENDNFSKEMLEDYLKENGSDKKYPLLFPSQEDAYAAVEAYKASLLQDMSAVTAACMMMKKKVFEKAGGFTEELAVAFNDVDLCYKIYEEGYYNVVRNDLFLFHHESLSRGKDGESEEKQLRLLREKDYLYEKHQDLYGRDPFYHPYLTTDMLETEYTPAFRYQVDLSMPWAKVKKCTQEVLAAREDECLVIGMECAMDIYKWKYGVSPEKRKTGNSDKEDYGEEKKDSRNDNSIDSEDQGYYFQGYSFVIGSDNACYKKELLLRRITDGNQQELGNSVRNDEKMSQPVIYGISIEKKYREDIKTNLKDQVNVDLTGYAAKLKPGAVPPGRYQFGMLAKDACSRVKLVNWSSWTIEVL